MSIGTGKENAIRLPKSPIQLEHESKGDTVIRDWRGNLTILYQKPDTVQINVYYWDSSNHLTRTKGYKIVTGLKYTVAEGDAIFLQPIKSEIIPGYLNNNKQPIKKEDVLQSRF